MIALTAKEIEEIYEKHFGEDTFSNYIIRDGTEAFLNVLLDEIEKKESNENK